MFGQFPFLDYILGEFQSGYSFFFSFQSIYYPVTIYLCICCRERMVRRKAFGSQIDE